MWGRPVTARRQRGNLSVTSIGSISRELDVREPAKQHGDHSCTRQAKEGERMERLLSELSRRAERKEGRKELEVTY